MCMGGGGSSNPTPYTAGNVADNPTPLEAGRRSTDPKTTQSRVLAQNNRRRATMLTGGASE
ncbi:MAG: hypothetical protein GY938_31965 [Ketobacter sp.]|nr:hypothetical protein [Ketobacter sp.]